MSEFFDHLIAEALQKDKLIKSIKKNLACSKESEKIYNKIIDMAVIRVFENTIENDLLCIVFKSLSRTERLVILFNVLMDYDVEETASVIGTNRDRVYSRKCDALKKFRDAIEGLDK